MFTIQQWFSTMGVRKAIKLEVQCCIVYYYSPFTSQTFFDTLVWRELVQFVSRVAESEVKCPTPTRPFRNFRLLNIT